MLYRASNSKAFVFLITPILLLLLSLILFNIHNSVYYFSGMIVLSFFLTQTFFLLHECGHLNFFESKPANKLFGHICGFLTGIPFYTWVHMHNLHHKWTGWRDLDPTTEKTVKPTGSFITKWIANVCWFLFIPVFYITYMFSNYWNVFKIKRFVSSSIFVYVLINVALYILAYWIVFYFFSKFILTYIMPAFLISLVLKELVIMTQHTHIEIPLSDGRDVKPVSYGEQIKYTRSFYTHAFLSHYFLLNFNLHEAHHAYPGIPAYWLDKIELQTPKSQKYFEWFKKAKSLKGEDFVFKTSKQTGKYF